MKRKSSIPLVRLNLLQPFIRELDQRGLCTNQLLARNGLARDTLDDKSIFVPVIVIHRFLEDVAVEADDPHFGVAVGETLDWSNWPPMIEAASEAKNLVGFLVRFIRAASSESSSATHELVAGADYAVFREKRSTSQEILPAQNDAFTAAYTLSLLQAAAGSIWKADRVRLTVCDPNALPGRYLNVNIYEGDRMGVSVRFPSEWLVEPFYRESILNHNRGTSSHSDLPVQFRDALQHVIMQHLHDPNLNVASIAAQVGLSPQKLQRQLRKAGMTLTQLIRNLRRKRAIEELLETRRTIAEISTALGYENANSFTRAFKAWTGFSPRAYRKQDYSMRE